MVLLLRQVKGQVHKIVQCDVPRIHSRGGASGIRATMQYVREAEIGSIVTSTSRNWRHKNCVIIS